MIYRWCLILLLTLFVSFNIDFSATNAQTFSPFSGQRISYTTNKFLEVDILPNGTVVFNPQNNIDVTTFEGYFGDVRDYAMFSNLNTQVGNFSITLEFGTVEYFYELVLVGYVSVDNGIVQLVSYDIISNTIDQVSEELFLMNQNDNSPNGQINVAINFDPYSTRKRRIVATPQPKKRAQKEKQQLMYNKKDVILEGGLAREIFMKSYMEMELDKQLEEMKGKEARKRYVFTNPEDPIADMTMREDLHPPEDFNPPDHIILDMSKGENGGPPVYKKPSHAWDKPDKSLHYNFKKTKLKIPDKLRQEYINKYNEKFLEHYKAQNSPPEYNDGQNGGGSRRRAISVGGAIAAGKVGDNEFFDEVGGQCKNLNGFTGLIGSKVDGCALESVAYLGGQVEELDGRLTVVEGQIEDIIKVQNLTKQAIEKLAENDLLIQQQIGLIGQQIDLVYEEFAASDYKFNQLATSQALTSESIVMMSSTVKILESQQQRAQWLTDQNFYATQEAFSGIASQQQAAINQVNTNIEYLRLQQNANSAVQMRTIYFSIAETLVQAQTLTDQLRLEINIQADYGFETQQLINNQIQSYLNSIYFMAKNQESVIVNLFPSIRDLQRMTFGNTNLGVEYYIYKNMIANQQSSSLNDGYQVVTINGTGKPPNPINEFIIIDGWSFNASWIVNNATCVTNNINNAINAVGVTMNSKAMMNIQVPNSQNPYMIQSSLTVSDNNVSYTFAGNATDFSHLYFIGAFVGTERYLLCFDNIPNFGLLVADSPTVRTYTQNNNNYFPPLFAFAKWRQVSYNVNTQTLTEQVVVSPLYAQKVGSSYVYYYLTVNAGCGFILKQMTNVYTDNIDNLFVINTYTSDTNQLYTNFLQQQPFFLYNSVMQFTVMPTVSNQYTYYPQINNNFLWAKQNCTLSANIRSGPNTTLTSFYIDSFTTPNYILNSSQINSQSETQTNTTVGGILTEYNITTTKRSVSSGEVDKKSKKKSPPVMVEEDFTPSGLKLPQGWRDMLPKPEGRSKVGDSKKYERMEMGGKGRRGLSPTGQSQQPLAMSDCYFGMGSTQAVQYTWSSFMSTVGSIPRTQNLVGPSNTDLANQCVRKPGCSMYQVVAPNSATFWDNNNNPTEFPAGTKIYLGNIATNWTQNQASFLYNTKYIVTMENATHLVTQQSISGIPSLEGTSIPYICGSYVVNGITEKISDTVEYGPALAYCMYLRWLAASYTDLLVYKISQNTPWGEQYFAFCGPYDQGLLTSFNANPSYSGAFDYSNDGWGNLTTSNVGNCADQTNPYSNNNKLCYGITFNTYNNPLPIYMSVSGCQNYDWNGCVDPTLNGLCTQTVLVDSSLATPGGGDMSPGCGFIENDYLQNCTGLGYAACINFQVTNVNGDQVPLCAWRFQTGVCNLYNPVSDRAALFTSSTLSPSSQTIGVNCNLRLADYNACTFDGYCMLQQVLGIPSEITLSSNAICVPLSNNITSAPFNTYQGGNFNPTLYPLSLMQGYGFTQDIINQCTDPAVFCSVSGQTNTTYMNWIFQALSTDPDVLTCESLSITLTNSQSCTSRLYGFDQRVANGTQYVPMCRLSNSKLCQSNCDYYGTDLNTCLSKSYCWINQNSLNCFNQDNYMSVCPQFANAPTIPGSQCIGVQNVCTMLDALQNTTGGNIPEGLFGAAYAPYVGDWSIPLLRTSECLVLASAFTGNLSLFPSVIGPASHLYGLISLPQQLSRACISYDNGNNIFQCYPANVFQLVDSDVFSLSDATQSATALEALTNRQNCIASNIYECLNLLEYQTSVPACAYVTSQLRTLGTCTRIDNVPYVINKYGEYVTVYDQAGYIKSNQIETQIMNLTPLDFVAIFGTSPTTIVYPGSSSSYFSLVNNIVKTQPDYIPCDHPGFVPVGSLCCMDGVCNSTNPWYQNLNHPQWAYLNYLQTQCQAATNPGTWAQSTDSEISTYCIQQYSYSSVVYDPSLPSTFTEIARIQALIASGNAPTPTPHYVCKQGMKPYLASLIFPFTNSLPTDSAGTVDSFGNVNYTTLVPLQYLDPTSPTDANGTYLLATDYSPRPVSPTVFIDFLGTAYGFTYVTSYETQSLSFSNSFSDMSSLNMTLSIGRPSSGLTTGWTTTNIIPTSLYLTLGNDTEAMLNTNQNIYGDNPAAWAVRPAFGAVFNRQFGGTTPDGLPAAKVDSLTFGYASNYKVPVWVISGITQTFTSRLVITNSDGTETIVTPTNVLISTQATQSLPVLGNYLIFNKTDSYIFAGYGPSITPCTPGVGYFCSDTPNFDPEIFFQTVSDYDPFNARSLMETAANVINNLTAAEQILPIAVCGDALGSITSLPVTQTVTSPQITFVLEFLNYDLLVNTPNCNPPGSLICNGTLWDWWVGTISNYGYAPVINAFNQMIDAWSLSRCSWQLSNWVPNSKSYDFVRNTWNAYYNPNTNQMNVVQLRAAFALIYAKGNTYACGNCIFLSANNSQSALLPPPTDSNGNVLYGYCIKENGTVIPQGTTPTYIVDAIKTYNNIICANSAAFSVQFDPVSADGSSWSFTLTARNGVGTIQPFFNTPQVGDVWAMTSPTLCPLLTNGTAYSSSSPGSYIANLTNPFPMALDGWVRVRQNYSEVQNLQNLTSGNDPCSYDKQYTMAGINSTIYPVDVCSGTSYVAFWSNNLGVNCTPWFQVNNNIEAYYLVQSALVEVQYTYYQTALIENQRKLDESFANLYNVQQQEIQLTEAQILQLNSSTTAQFNSVYQTQQQFNVNLQNTTSITVQNSAQIQQLNVGYTQIYNNLTNTNQILGQVEQTQLEQQVKLTNISEALGNETIEREAANKVLQDEINLLGEEVIKNVAEVNNITAEIDLILANLTDPSKSAYYSNANQFYQTGWGQSVQYTDTAIWITFGIWSSVNTVLGILGTVSFAYYMRDKKNDSVVQAAKMNPAASQVPPASTTQGLVYIQQPQPQAPPPPPPPQYQQFQTQPQFQPPQPLPSQFSQQPQFQQPFQPPQQFPQQPQPQFQFQQPQPQPQFQPPQQFQPQQFQPQQFPQQSFPQPSAPPQFPQQQGYPQFVANGSFITKEKKKK